MLSVITLIELSLYTSFFFTIIHLFLFEKNFVENLFTLFTLYSY